MAMKKDHIEESVKMALQNAQQMLTKIVCSCPNMGEAFAEVARKDINWSGMAILSSFVAKHPIVTKITYKVLREDADFLKELDDRLRDVMAYTNLLAQESFSFRQCLIQRLIEQLQIVLGNAKSSCPSSGSGSQPKPIEDVASVGDSAGLRYASGYVLKKMKKYRKLPDLLQIFERMEIHAAENQENQWFLNAVDRGGLTRVHNRTFTLFDRIHGEFRKFLNGNTVVNFKTFWEKLEKNTTIITMWQDLVHPYDDNVFTCLKDVVLAVTGISGTAFAKNVKEKYRLNAHKAKQTKALRAALKPKNNKTCI